MTEARSGWHVLNLALALLVHVAVGLVWLVTITTFSVLALGVVAGVVWFFGALVLAVVAIVQMSRARERSGRVWWLTFRWWLLSWIAPVALLFVLVARFAKPAPAPESAPESEPERRVVMDPELPSRLASFERRLRALESELTELKWLAARPEAEPASWLTAPTVTVPPPPVVPPSAPVPPVSKPEPPVSKPEPPREPLTRPAPRRPAPTPVATATRAEQPPREPRIREVDWADLLGARALAVAGGVVTVLGIVFFFALAVNRGWVGPELRVGLGALASLLVFAGGFELRRRYEETHAALAAVGAGIAGAYATTLFAAARYDLVPDLGALALAAGIAAVALFTALAWSAQLVAGLGLVGAMVVPFTVVITDDISAIGTAFVAVMLAVTGFVALRRRWDWLLAAAAGVSLPQAALLVGQADPNATKALALTVVFFALYGGIGLARLLELDDRIDAVGGGFVALAGVFAAVSFQHLLEGAAFGATLLALTAAYGALSTWFLRGRASQSMLLAAIAGWSLPQAALFVAHADRDDAGAIVVVAALAAAYAAIGIARHLARAPKGLDPFGASFVTGSAGFAAVSSLHLLDGTARGVALLVLAATYGALSAVFFRGRRDLSSLLAAAGLILAAGAGGELLSGLGLATVWAAQGAVLSWLAWQTRESRFQVGSLGYLALAAGHALLFEAPPRDLFTATLHPADGAPALVAVAAGLLALAAYARHDERRSILAPIRIRQVDLRRGALVLTGVAGAAAASLGLLDLVERSSTFSWGEVGVTALWSALALAVLVVGVRRGSLLASACGLAAFPAPVAKVVASDMTLPEPQRWWAGLAAALACVAGGFLFQLLRPRLRTLHVVGVVLHVVGLGLGAPAVIELIGHDRLGVALLVVAGAYGALAAGVFALDRQRDHATLLWSISLAFAAVAAANLLDGTVLVLAWTAPAAALALLARPVREPRFLLASAALVTVALAETLTELAPPSDIASSGLHPGGGVVALALSIGALAVLARIAPDAAAIARDDETRSESYRELARSLLELEPAVRIPVRWAAGLLGLYTVSLTILEVFERWTPGGVEDRFQHGHTLVSACWAAVALALLYVGLTRRMRRLRVAGFVLFGGALAKLFLYDLATLSSIARALSFLAVGALLLVAGFFYQRLTSDLELRSRTV